MKTVEEILKPFESAIKDNRSNYDTIMRGILASNPELRTNIDLFDAVAERVQKEMQISVSKYYGQNLIAGHNGMISKNGIR